MPNRPLTLSILDGSFAVCRLSPDATVPDWATLGAFTAITRTADELSVICPAANVPAGTQAEAPLRCLKVEGPLDFSLIGILASLATPLAVARVWILAVSTYNTDYLLVKESQLDLAVAALTQAGHSIQRQGDA